MSNLTDLSSEDTQTLIELSSKGGYWAGVVTFLASTYSNLTAKQQDWLNTVRATLVVETNRRIARELYGDSKVITNENWREKCMKSAVIGAAGKDLEGS